MSSPKSGTNLTIASIQFFTHQPRTYLEMDFARDHPAQNRLGVDIDFSLDQLITCHGPKKVLKHFDPECDKLVLITRNYKELIVRENGSNLKTLEKKLETFKRHYFERFELYEQWNKKKRHLVFYEDIILDPKKTLTSLLTFLEVDLSNLDEYVDNFESYKSKCLESYQNQFSSQGSPASISKGKDILFYCKSVSEELLQKIDEEIKDSNFFIWQKYLKRFSE